MPTIITDIRPTVLRRTGIGRVAFSVTHTHHEEELLWVQREEGNVCILTRKQGGRKIGWLGRWESNPHVTRTGDFKSPTASITSHPSIPQRKKFFLSLPSF